MAKLSELLTGPPEKWRRVRCKEWPELAWVVIKFITPSGIFVGYDSDGRLFNDEELKEYDDWQYYEEPTQHKYRLRGDSKELESYNCVLNRNIHVFCNDNIKCQCQLKEPEPIELTCEDVGCDCYKQKPKVKRWMWAYHVGFENWMISTYFCTDEEIKREIDNDKYIKLPWTETEFPE